MPTRRRTSSTALLDEPELAISDMDRDVTPAKTRGRPRKSTTAPATRGRPGRKPGTVTITNRGSDGKILSEAAMKAKVAGELGMMLALGVAGLEFRDPDMAACITEPVQVPGVGEVDPIETFVDKFVNQLARNKKALAYAAKGEGITEIASMIYIAFTVGKRMVQVSAARRRGAEDGYDPQGALRDDDYPTYSPTGR